MAWHVLAIDDDTNACKKYRKVLRGKGFRVKTAGTSFEVLARLDGVPPDLVLLDVGMQDQSGWDTLRTMRDTAEWEDVPVLIVTELGNLKSVSQGWELGCTRYLHKPFDADYLESAVGDILSERHSLLKRAH